MIVIFQDKHFFWILRRYPLAVDSLHLLILCILFLAYYLCIKMFQEHLAIYLE